MEYKQELITTIHDFGCDLDSLEAEITKLSEQSPTAVLIPALYEELERPALTNICHHLKDCRFIKLRCVPRWRVSPIYLVSLYYIRTQKKYCAREKVLPHLMST